MAGYLGGMMQQRRPDDEGVTREEKSTTGEFMDDPVETGDIGGREPPTSQVGYGGGERTAEFTYDTHGEDSRSSLEQQDHLGEGKAHGGRFVGGHGKADPRFSEDQPTMSSSEKVDKNSRPSESGLRNSGPGGDVGEGSGRRICGNYGTVHCNAKPSEAGYGSSGRGGYVGEGGANRSTADYDTVHPNARPSEAGFGSTGGYSGEGGLTVSAGHPENETEKSHPGGHREEFAERRIPVTHKSQHYQDSSEHYGGLPAPMRPPGSVLLDENHFDGPKYDQEPTTASGGDTHKTRPSNEPSDSLQEGEVRDGVPHGIVSGHPSGAGQDNHGRSEATRVPMSRPVGHQGLESQDYHQAESVPAGRSAYSQQYTRPDGPNMHASQLEEAYQQSDSTPGPLEKSNVAPVAMEQSDGQPKAGLMAKIKSHLPGHHKHHVGPDVANEHTTTEKEKPGFVEKIKDKLSPGHHESGPDHHTTSKPE